MTPVTFGGAEKVNLNFLANADRERFIIDPILFLRPWEEKTAFETELKKFGIRYKTIPVAKTCKIDLFRVIRCYRYLKKVIADNEYDLIHTHGYLADFFGYLVSKATNIPIMSTCHGFIKEGVKLSFYNRLDLLVLKYFNHIITVSEDIKNDFVRQGMISDKISIIINATQMDAHDNDYQYYRSNSRAVLNIKENDIVIGYTGRLTKEKGLAFLFEAVSMLVRNFLPIRLLIIGEGPQKNELVALAKSLDISSNVFFAGFQLKVDRWVAAMDFFVLPSLMEGTPMALLEAMSQGVPCIASAVGGVPQVIDSGIDGILVAPGNPKEICDAISALCADVGLRDVLSGNAKHKIAHKYNIKQWTERIECVYLDILKINSSIQQKRA